jgi:hypothetical protein
MAAQRRRTWDEKELGRIVAARADGLSTYEIAQICQSGVTSAVSSPTVLHPSRNLDSACSFVAPSGSRSMKEYHIG